jgi:hypothetical protein
VKGKIPAESGDSKPEFEISLFCIYGRKGYSGDEGDEKMLGDNRGL